VAEYLPAYRNLGLQDASPLVTEPDSPAPRQAVVLVVLLRWRKETPKEPHCPLL
jgi:hypothetical protein